MSLDMGPNPLWQLEALLTQVEIKPGMKVLDLGCGRGATSVFLTRELDARVMACDLWVPEEELRETLEHAGVSGQAEAINADARALPFDADEFDVVVSIDAFEYFGTDVRFLPSLLKHLRSGGQLGMTTPGLVDDPYDATPPATVTDVVGWEVGAWHSPSWWATHWGLSRLVDQVRTLMQPGSQDDWLTWAEMTGEPHGSPLMNMLQAQDSGVGFVLASAVKR